ncbi:hypothetical protein [Butyricimonas sp.]|uniref:hypothetical protein n=1 Tax=Butyricimonas sp. TaxID=1969738 RepID=UPI0025BBCFE6|nr:hypothetical protein [Butyricimonas sp.]
MIKNQIYWIMLFLLGCISCADDDNVGNIDSFGMLRFEFPQGSNSWDKEIEQIAKDWGMYIIYKDVDSTDLNRTWTESFGTTNPRYVCNEPSNEDIQVYLGLVKEWLLGSLDKTNKEHLKQLPLYLYLVNDYRDNNPVSPTYKKHVQLNTAGFDYWSLSFTSEELEAELTPKMIHSLACTFSYPGIKTGFTSGEYKVAPGFEDMSNYEDKIGIRYVSLEEFWAQYPYWNEVTARENYDMGLRPGSMTPEKDPENAFLRRGFAPQVSESFTLVTTNYGTPTWMPWIVKEIRFPGSPVITQEMNPDYASIPERISERVLLDFLNMIRLAMLYSKEKIREMFPLDAEESLERKGYQIINDKYDLVVEYMKTTYDIDVTRYAAILDSK